jgi:chaperonin cofactor prefoldin
MEVQTFLNYIAAAVMALLGWLGKTVWDAVQDLKNDIKHIEVELPTHYVRKDEMDDRFDKLESMINRRFDELKLELKDKANKE